jgi:hypothetical protein
MAACPAHGHVIQKTVLPLDKSVQQLPALTLDMYDIQQPACAVPRGVWPTASCAVPGRVCLQEPCAAPVHVCTVCKSLALELSALVLNLESLSTRACAAPVYVCIQEPCLYTRALSWNCLCFSTGTPPGTVCLQEPVLHLYVCFCTAPGECFYEGLCCTCTCAFVLHLESVFL